MKTKSNKYGKVVVEFELKMGWLAISGDCNGH